MNPEDEALREFESAANKTCIARQHAMEAAQRTCLKLRIEIEQLTKERDRCVLVHNKAHHAYVERVVAERDAEQLRADKAETVRDEYVQRAIETTRELSAALKRADKAEAACAELRRHVETWTNYYNTMAGVDRDKSRRHALSSDCGKGHIPASELDFFKEAYLRDACNGCYPLPYGECKQKREVMNRLESLRREQSQ